MRVGWIVCGGALLVGAPRISRAEPASRLNELVVTATRNGVPKRNVTKSVSVVTSDDIKRLHIGTVQDVVRDVPGAFVRQSGAIGRTSSVVIRGSSDKQVLVLVDEIGRAHV